MMRILVRHAKLYRSHTFLRTLSSSANQTLQNRLTEALDQKAQIIPVLKQWRQQGNHINPSHVRVIIEKLRDSDQSLQALQVSEWMLDNVVELEEAEKFFESIPHSARDGSVYTSLLALYARSRSDKTLPKAEATFEKMRELRLLTSPSPYNAMMSLYGSLNNRDKVDDLLREMQANNVAADSVTLNHVSKLYLSDVTPMGKLSTAWEENCGNWSTLEWLITLDMATACLKDGSQEKAVKLLTSTEKLLVDPKSFKQAYELLTKLYGEAEKKEEVLRIWNLCNKTTEQCCDSNDYLTVISSLLKLDAIAEAGEIYKVWESLPLEFDIRIPTMLASGYRGRGMLDEAEKLMKSLIKNIRMRRPINPLLDQWGSRMRVSELKCLIKNLHDSNQFSKALQVSEWMDEKRACNIYPEDYAARLHMVEVVLGLEEAEKFFKNIPENMKDYTVYATLLSSYAKSDTHLGKAKAIFEKMRELGFLMKPSPFNSMLSFHSQRNMVEEFLREMEENNVAPDSLMVNKVLGIYAAEPNVEATETFMKKWSGEEGIKLETETMAAVAKTYAKAGSIEKAIEMFGGVAGSKEEVYRLWNEFKENAKLEYNWYLFWNENEKLKDDMYKTVIATLLKLDDVEGAEKVYGEWTPVGPNLDLSIPGLLISRFCAEGNKLKFSELISSIRGKMIEMHLRTVKAFIGRVVTYVFVFCVVVVLSMRKCWWIWFWPRIF
ncbi:Tetratricopeptide repeat (TPR)-like superfamily protein [Raphanus sativus]|uniref:Pentatricopeptide repeat-containing protein At1g28020 n=1 Tax=Raphanus sativus TaxID=3726 RepID=A0A9W3DPS3_RAPSA|nr:putative pentatricopeptide repeat-containing protein At1g28020 [Raphanus sativus]KAJ4916734.1 Tetratricopeptide repeat (TPR)-like superfamily protein [Raphanus sativus]